MTGPLTPLFAQVPKETPYDERVCKHGKKFTVHCRECSFAGFCGCLDCRKEDAA